MDTSNWRPNQGGSGGVESSMESGDWRTQLPAHSRQKIVNKIMDGLKKHLPFSGQEKLHELKSIAERLEEKIYIAATSQSDYKRKITMKILTLETRSPIPMPNSLQTCSAGSNVIPSDPGIGSEGMQQANNQGQSLPVPAPSNHPQAGPQILPQTIHNNIASSEAQGSAGASSALPPGSGLSHISGVQQNYIGNIMGQGMPPSNFVSQIPIAGRQQLAAQQKQQQHSQNSQHHLYQHQLHQFAKQNNIATHQQHLRPQSSVAGQRQLIGTQSGMPRVLNNQHSAQLLQSTVPIQQQNLPTGGQQSQPQLQRRMMSPITTESGQLKHQLNMTQQPTSGALQPQNVTDQQKLLVQQRAVPEASSPSTDSTAQTGNRTGGDWQEEVYQEMKAMKDKYMPDLEDLHRRAIHTLQHHESLSQQCDKLKVFLNMLERSMAFLQIPKNKISPNFKEKLGTCETRLVNLINTHKRKPGVTQQEAQAHTLPPARTHSLQQSQQTQSHLTPLKPREIWMNSQAQSANFQHNSVPGVSIAQQNTMGALQPSFLLDPGQNSMKNMSSSQGGVGSLLPGSNMLQHPQLKQLQHHQTQQQFHQQTQEPQNAQLQANQLPQFHQMNNASQISLKSESLQQPVASQRSFYHQQVKPGALFSPQLLPSASPLTPQHPSPQMDQQNLLNSLTKFGTPLQSAKSAFIVPSPVPGNFEKVNSCVSSPSNAGNIGHQPTGPMVPSYSPSIGTARISSTPLLAEFTGPGGNGASTISGKLSDIEQPMEDLIKVVKSISHNSLSAAVNDIGSVVSMMDGIAGSVPGNGSRSQVGENLVDMTKCHLQERNFVTQDGAIGMGKTEHFTGARPINVVSSASLVNDRFKHLNRVEASELESTATSTMKRPRIEANYALLEEIRAINRGLIDTMVDIIEKDADQATFVAPEVGDGILIKCSFRGIALSPKLKLQYASAQMEPIEPLLLLVPPNYPNRSPLVLDQFPIEAINIGAEDLSTKSKSRFISLLRTLSEPATLKEIVRAWDFCVRAVIREYAKQSGGGTFSSKYGKWDHV